MGQGPVSKSLEEYAGLPNLHAYLRGLPNGLSSHAETLVKASTISAVGNMLPEGFPMGRVPNPVRDLLERPPPVSSWIPEVNAVAVLMAVRDLGFATDEKFLDWMRAGFEQFWGGSLYRVLMAVASPARLARGGSKRWSAIRRGSTREIVEMFPNGNIARVSYPENLANPLYAKATCVGIEVAYRMSRAKDPSVTVVEHTATYYITQVLYDRRLPLKG